MASGKPLDLPPRSKVPDLLAYLLLEAQEPVSREIVAARLWPDVSATPPATQVEATVESDRACTYEALVNLFCRQGADQRFPIVDSLTPGQQASVIGMSSDGLYWFLEGPLSGRPCTVPQGEQYGVVTGTCEGLPSFTPMPTPSDTPTMTPSPTATPDRSRETPPTSTPIPPPA